MAKKKLPVELSEYLRKIGAKGGKRSLDTMTAEERAARAKKAAAKSAEVRRARAAAKKRGGSKKPGDGGRG